MKGIPLKGYTMKDGKVVKKPSRQSVSQKIRQKKSKRQRVVKRGTT
jgi:hypothetical protein